MIVSRSCLARLWKGLNWDSTFSLNIALALTPLTVRLVHEMPKLLGCSSVSDSNDSSLRNSPARCHCGACEGFSECDGSFMVVEDVFELPETWVWLIPDILEYVVSLDGNAESYAPEAI